jgi:dolichol-phosphate mannosyltransferase
VETGSSAAARARRVLIATATYNEIENLPSLVDEIFRYALQAEVLVIDDNSPDGTGEWCRARAALEPRLRLLARPGKLGQGSAIIAAVQYAIREGYDDLVTMDADFSHQPRYVPALLARLRGNGDDGSDARPVDVAIGSRYVTGGAIQGWPWRR